MSDAPVVEIVHRNRFVALPGATARRTRANAWEVTIPKSEAVAKLLRKAVSASAFDGVTFAIDGEESVHALGSAEDRQAVRVTVLLP